jgi:hypothetical protein
MAFYQRLLVNRSRFIQMAYWCCSYGLGATFFANRTSAAWCCRLEHQRHGLWAACKAIRATISRFFSPSLEPWCSFQLFNEDRATHPWKYQIRGTRPASSVRCLCGNRSRLIAACASALVYELQTRSSDDSTRIVALNRIRVASLILLLFVAQPVIFPAVLFTPCYVVKPCHIVARDSAEFIPLMLQTCQMRATVTINAESNVLAFCATCHSRLLLCTTGTKLAIILSHCSKSRF